MRPLTRIDHALVFSAPDGSYDTYLPPVRPTRAGAAAKRYTSVYEVDMGVHLVREEIGLPSDDDAFEFAVTVELSWQVVDPARFVASEDRDVPRLLISELEQAARPVARGYPVSRSADAEQALLREVPAQGALGTRAGLAVTWAVRMRGDLGVIDHVRRMRSIDHAATEQIHTEQRGREHDAAIDRRVREQDALQWGRSAEFEEQQHELRLRQQKWQHAEAVDRTHAADGAAAGERGKDRLLRKASGTGRGPCVGAPSGRPPPGHRARGEQPAPGATAHDQGADGTGGRIAERRQRGELRAGGAEEEGPPGLDRRTEPTPARGHRAEHGHRPASTVSMPGAVMQDTPVPGSDRTDADTADGGGAPPIDAAPFRKAAPGTDSSLSVFPGWQPPPGYGSAPLREADAAGAVNAPRTVGTALNTDAAEEPDEEGHLT